ncbi:putative WW domain-binding protein [Helianthus debilis subsp. tardiflorus]
MTEYWVSQGKKWCDLCKIFINNSTSSIRNHELGQRHKDNVTKRLSNMRDEKVAKDKQKKETARVLSQIEEKATRSYQKDISTATSLGAPASSEGTEWEHDTSSGYYYCKSNGCYYDPNSGFYYTDALGKWVTQEEAFAAAAIHSTGPIQKKPMFANATPSLTSTSQNDSKVQRSTVNPTRSVNKPSSLAINKRKRADNKPKVISEEEAAALKAREAARKRVEEREKTSLGLYKRCCDLEIW